MASLLSKAHCSFRISCKFTHFSEPGEGTGIAGVSRQPRQILCSLLVSYCFLQVGQAGRGARVTGLGGLPGELLCSLRLSGGHFHFGESGYGAGIACCCRLLVEAFGSL